MSPISPYQERFEQALARIEPLMGEESRLREACLYSLEAGGKRIRPALVYMVADALGGKGGVDEAALSIELLHTASLIADDLPCMDDDEMRRGRPTLHCAFDETIAYLASYALIGAGYELLGIACESRPEVAPLALKQVAASTGIRGISGGQYLDLYHPEQAMEAVEMKTAALFESSLVLGWLFGGGDIRCLPQVSSAGKRLGVAFQLLDDLLDLDQDREKGSLNLALAWGVERTAERFHREHAALLRELSALRIDAEPLLNLLATFAEEVDAFSLL
ncbi:MAG: polyprenyl synthetase family protein [Parachlamydiales bacterium]